MNGQAGPSGKGKFEKRAPQKIDRAYIITQLLLNINQKALEGSAGFILAVNTLEDNLAPHDPKYRKQTKELNAEIHKLAQHVINSDDSTMVINEKLGTLEWKRARSKLQFLNELLKRSGLEKEMRFMLNESYEDDEDETEDDEQDSSS